MIRRLSCAVALFALGLLSACDRTSATPTAAAENPAKPEAAEGAGDEVKLTAKAVDKFGFTTEPARKRVLAPTLLAPARVTFNVEGMAHVVSLLRGRIVQLRAKRGDDVKAGDVLVLIESPELGEAQSEFLQKRTSVALAQATAELSKDAATRARSLYDVEKGISLTEVLKREGDSKVALTALSSAQSMLRAAENRLRVLGMDQPGIEKLTASSEVSPVFSITAPIDGRVVDEHVMRGALVGPDKDALFVLADLSTLWVVASVPETRLPEIAVGARASVKIAGVEGVAATGSVSLIEPSLDPDTRTARVRIEVTAGKSGIRSGMFALAEIVATGATPGEPVVTVSEDAIQTVDGKPAVFVPVKDKEHTFARRAVIVGKATGGFVPVYSGLEEGELVVVKSSFVLKAELTKGSGED
jgi:cobalt-zinc-cadmium efflux system membrane fusion protein